MERAVGTIARGLRTPIITSGDNIVEIVVDAVLNASSHEGYAIRDKDVVSITESVIARAQGNYAHIDDIAQDITAKFGRDTIGVIFPIFSRNRFSVILKGIAKAAKKVVLMLNYPSDEQGNSLVDLDLLDEKGINPWSDTLTEKQFRQLFGQSVHPFTGIDYIDYYGSILKEYGQDFEIILANNPKAILKYTKSVLVCDVHSRSRTKRMLAQNGAEKIFGQDDLLTAPLNGSGYNAEYGLLGSNKASEKRVKLFPRDCQRVVDEVQAQIKAKTGKLVEVMVYGDGAFKDPVGGIWELADPVVSPAFTQGLAGTPCEIKLKYLADNQFGDLKGQELKDAVTNYLKGQETQTKDAALLQGTTPRQLTDLLGSLSDLTSGSGDKGTPVVYIQGYFDSYAK